MADTKERILTIALQLFSREGYEAVSMRMIADALGITKGALYKHYESKRDIFDHIVARMRQADAQRAQEYAVPEGTLAEMADAYRHTSFAHIQAFSEAQFRYWTEEPFPAQFRKLLTLEQYRSAELAALYQQYLAAGPLQYMTDLFGEMTDSAEDAGMLALSFYAPMFMLYSLYDGAEDKDTVFALLHTHIVRFAKERSFL